jgi:hypothetical protein
MTFPSSQILAIKFWIEQQPALVNCVAEFASCLGLAPSTIRSRYLVAATS